MAEALGVIGSLIAVYQLADRSAQILSGIRHAPTELLALHNEVSDLAMTIKTVETCLKTNDSLSVLETGHVVELLKRAKCHLLQLNELIHMRFLKPGTPNGVHKISRLRWALAKGTVERHRSALRDVRNNIMTELVSINYSMLSKIPLLIEEISLKTDRMQVGELDASNQILRQLTTQPDSTVTLSGDGASRHEPSVNTNPAVVSVVRFRASVLRLDRQCSSYCRCGSRESYSFRSSQNLDQILGILFIGYSGQPFTKRRKCSRLTCQDHLGFQTQVNYLFPFWFVKQLALNLIFVSGCRTESKISLTVRGTFARTSDMFQCIRLDDDDGLRRLFTFGGARPDDHGAWNGKSALYLAVVNRRFKVCKALLEAGADPTLARYPLKSPFVKAWELVYENRHDITILNMLRALFPDTDNSIVEDLCFSKLHMAVLGLSRNSLETDLLEHEDQINEVDISGNTPLAWAVRRADLKATKDLLEAGADPDTCGTITPNSCLMHAAAGENLEILKLLLEAGSSPFTDSDTNALHWAAETSHCADIIDVLVTAGVNIEQRSLQGGTPLGQAVIFNNVIAMKSLLKFQPNLNVQDWDGDTPLIFACFSGFKEAVKILLEHGADYTMSNNYGETVIHCAARAGDLEMLNILRAANLMKINPHQKNSDGKTAFELAQQRQSKVEGFMDLFLVLFFEIRCRNDYAGWKTERNEDTGALESVGSKEEGSNQDTWNKMPGAWPRD